ncbi:hypothetical protein [Persicitalea jodogahamensis]|uniref:Uncharacterized protein n=1 Tax=Persicitalea jodogahamensis TaxID=402147 RepID=A0A8J3D603_9BACT|nr:hypothetical protein [Persicitalea jodogahamensis]GHB54784.1 hypothetical protein GCM10007390_04880 [Persicitalea jodogahamensis]
MKKQIHLWLIVLALGCQNREKFPSGVDPLLVGKWEQTAYEEVLSNGTKEWKTLDSLTGKPSFIVRSDGALLSGDGKEYCCISFEKYVVNGEVYFPKIKEPVPENEECLRTFCGICSEHKFQIEGDEMVWTYCGSRSRYRRLP